MNIEIDACIALATETGLPMWRTLAMYWRGALLSARGNGEAGIAQMREAWGVLQSMGVRLNRSVMLVMLAEAYSRIGAIDQGFTALTEAAEIMTHDGERYCEAELFRVKGDLLLRQSPDHVAQAETSYGQALEIARSQQAKSLELRSAISLSRLWKAGEKRQDAYELLAPVYDWFTEGFDTADLMDAKTLLVELEEGR